MSDVTPLKRDEAHIRIATTPSKHPDAGLRGLGHYERRLPSWRFHLRQRLIPVVRWETPYLAKAQHVCRTPFFDSYFAISANLGTHTFFMTALPICFWCGYPETGNALVHMLALGVYLSGFVKDLVCLPRPLSPPLQRITMSGSAALEYGFPSTHTTNAVSVAVYCLWQLFSNRESYSEYTYYLLCALCYCYAISITIGRMYCGMHGFFDVISGGTLGIIIAWIRIAYGQAFDTWVLHGDWFNPGLTIAILLIAVRVHPEPADNCPCFDDSVSFAGVVMGCTLGMWHHAYLLEYVFLEQPRLKSMFTFENHDLRYPVARVVLGIIIIFMWRAVMKPLLLTILPPIFRFVDTWGINIPRRYFLESRYYKTVPHLGKDDNVIPSASAIPNLVSNLRHPRQRAVSVGPQSEADAREFIANREQRRRDSRASLKSRPSLSTIQAGGTLISPASPDEEILESDGAVLPTNPSSMGDDKAPTRRRLHNSNNLAPQILVDGVAETSQPMPPANENENEAASDSSKEDEKNDREMFSNLEKPRIRYDVEVITKLVVYAGIGWLALEGNPLLFKWIGMA